MNLSYRRIGTIVWLIVILFSCNEQPEKKEAVRQDSLPSKKPPGNLSPAGTFSEQTELRFDSIAIIPFLKKFPAFTSLLPDLQKFYASRKYAYAWYDGNGLIEQSDNLYNHLLNLQDEGLPDTVLYRDSLSMVFDQNPPLMNAENELMLTAQYFTYARKVWGGLSEKETKAINWFLPRKKLDLPVLLDSLLRDSSVIGKGYIYSQYNLLRNFLAIYRKLQSEQMPAIEQANKKSYIKGDSTKAIAEIRERLFMYGDLASNSGSAVFDEDLVGGVKKFQTRLGLATDGSIGAGTLRKLNTSLDEYIRQIIVNMERCRWVPASLNGDYLIVNIPAYTLFVYEKDSLAFTMKVVVGKAVHKTVIFNGDLKYVVFSPYWNVPPDIMKNEVLPGIRRDPNYLSRNNMEWNGKQVRQKPGPKNSLGLVKFLFPNSHNIYLHDSPAKSLFNEASRAFSHGCIRVAEPKKLALYLLRNYPQWSVDKVDKAMNSAKEQYVTLTEPVPVYIAYLTAWVGKDGKLNLRDDIYNRDGQLASMIFKKGK